MNPVVAATRAALLLLISSGPLALRSADLVLNELMADNQSAVVHNGNYPDWLEIYNSSDQAKNLSGMRLTDDPLIPGKYVFPPNTVIASKGTLVVWCDAPAFDGALHTGFALSKGGSSVSLYSADTPPALLDSITFGFQIPDFSIGRVPDGSGGWQLTQATPGGTNVAQALGSVSQVKINEWMAKAASGSDWFELYNPQALPVSMAGAFLSLNTSDPNNTQLPQLCFIGPMGFRQFLADKQLTKGPDHVDFKLSASGSTIALFTPSRALADTVSFGSQTLGTSQGRLPDGSALFAAFPTTSTPGDSNYLPINNAVINEVLSHTDPPLEDAVELFNPTSSPADISGWFLSNSKNNLKKFRIPNGTLLPAGGYHVFYEYQFDPDPNNPNSFTFNSAHGDSVHLSVADANGNLTGYRVSQSFGAAQHGVSFGRYFTSIGVEFVPLAQRTFGNDNPTNLAEFRQGTGLSNAPPMVGPVVISEIMFNPPPTIASGVTNDNTLDEYIVLQNITTSRVVLFDPLHRTNTWRLATAVTYQFSQDAYIDQFAIVVGFDPIVDATALASFKSKFGVPDGVPIYGPWSGKLKNSGDTIDLLRPDDPQLPPHPDAGFVPYPTVESISYSNVAPWPTTASGTGASIHRRSLQGFGDDPANWVSGSPTPGRGPVPLSIASVRVQSGNVTLSFVADGPKTYHLQVRSSLGSGGWVTLKDVTAVAAGPVEVSDSITAGSSARFYRVVGP